LNESRCFRSARNCAQVKMNNNTGKHAAPSRRASRLRTAVLSASILVAAIGLAKAQADSPAPPTQTPSACSGYGGWIDVRTGRAIDRGELFGDLVARKAVVLLGESHTDVDHHQWELHTVAALHGRGGNLVLGFEAFPRRLQGVLDDWVAGKLTDEAFLKASEWRQVWGYDAALYMPLFQFARLNRIPMVALNVDRRLVAQVGQKGWEGVPGTEREGLSAPAPATAAYERELARVYAIKKALPPGTDTLSAQGLHPAEPDEAALADALKEPEFKRFVAAQQTWDRAMAEGLVSAKRKYADATVVGILGSGHVEGGSGVPHQLRDLGVTAQISLVPVTAEEACSLVGTPYADAVFTLQRSEEAPPERPRLGVALAQGDSAPRVEQVVKDSVAEVTGLKTGDQVVRAAGLEMRNPDDLVDVIARQGPGTWLPLSIRRDGQEMDFVAKFPPRPRQN
jgi:uncharacterized iron-regulated protein